MPKPPAGLVDGGADLLLIETIFDTLNAKAAIFGITGYFEAAGVSRPLMISGTITDASGRTLSGPDDRSVLHVDGMHARPLIVGLNCALGAEAFRDHTYALSQIADSYTSTSIPTLGCPTSSASTTTRRSTWPACCAATPDGLLNVVGGCCGTTPAHIRAFAEAVRDLPPRPIRTPPPYPRFSGLEPLVITPRDELRQRGRAYQRHRLAPLRQADPGRGDYTAALDVARQQVESGAQIIDINMDEGMLDAEAAMVRFLNLIAGEPDIARVPVMLDSSKWSVIEAGLKCVQGKSVVNSISLKEGEAEFLRQARLARRYGAAVVVMAFDEKGQAETVEQASASPTASTAC
jgi:5-methyltetrahydrofolate--homocysteine methyltransferase